MVRVVHFFSTITLSSTIQQAHCSACHRQSCFAYTCSKLLDCDVANYCRRFVAQLPSFNLTYPNTRPLPLPAGQPADADSAPPSKRQRRGQQRQVEALPKSLPPSEPAPASAPQGRPFTYANGASAAHMPPHAAAAAVANGGAAVSGPMAPSPAGRAGLYPQVR